LSCVDPYEMIVADPAFGAVATLTERSQPLPLTTLASRPLSRVRSVLWEVAVKLEMLREPSAIRDDYLRRVNAVNRKLHVPSNYLARGLPLHREAHELVAVPCGRDGKDRLMAPKAEKPWLALQSAASSDGVGLVVRHAFRSVHDQALLIRNRLRWGDSTIEELLTWIAAPGFSEHHTGCALDFENIPSGQAFENTRAFDWLSRNAGAFGFRLSYPQDNSYGMRFEPWHWCCVVID